MESHLTAALERKSQSESDIKLRYWMKECALDLEEEIFQILEHELDTQKMEKKERNLKCI